MSRLELTQILVEELGYAESPGFLQRIPWQNRRPIPDVDSAYFVQKIPVAYFSRLGDADPERLWNLHRRVWNQSKVPLLYVVLPQEIRVYNGYAEPAKTATEFVSGDRLLQHLQQLTDLESARQAIHRQLGNYDRLHIDTGAFWTTADGQRISRESRADQRLLKGMDQVRRHLLEQNLPNDLGYALLGRSIFIRYLEDRDILTSKWISRLTAGDADNYRAALHDLTTTYQLFENLNRRFNGDLFPVDDRERKHVRQKHLNLLGSFLDGKDLDSGQMSFWPYDFMYIPIELISGIYDTFLYSESEKKRREEGAYYTPLSLVDYIIEETLSTEIAHPDMKILDPACGSGIFLVRAYQRLVAAWQKQFNRFPSTSQFGKILQHGIYGVDKAPEAVRIAAFSLYLAMLDYLKKEDIINDDFRFPRLEGRNLFAADFFSTELPKLLSGQKFNRVIGNPPWGRSTLKGEASQWAKQEGHTIGGRQIGQAFLLRAPEFCTENGEVALLAPAKSTILVTSDPHEEFRQQFFNKFDVRAVINFSALCYELFSESLSPAVAIFYHPRSSSQGNKIVYGVPKPSVLSQQLGAIVLDATEIKFLDRDELLAHPVLWKVASWGTPRDAALIERLSSLPTLREQTELLGLKIQEGLIAEYAGSDKNKAPWLKGMPFVLTQNFQPYVVDLEACEPIEKLIFHRPRTPEIYLGPLALIRRSKCVAAFSDRDITYNNKITGIVGQPAHEPILKWLVGYINSPLAQYYHFLTSTSWAVERGTIIHEEYLRMPFLVPPDDDPRLKNVLYQFDQIADLLKERDELIRIEHQAVIQQHEATIAELVYDIYGLRREERELIQDTINYGIDFFYWAKKPRRKPSGSESVRHPDAKLLEEYAEAFIETVKTLLQYQGKKLIANVYQDGAPLSVVGFKLVNCTDAHEVQIVKDVDKLQETLKRLDRLLLDRQTPRLYMRRHVRIYDGSWLYLVRPSERRFWTRSQARADADGALMEWLSHSIPNTQE
ncbi:SAM-dependent methyltransferase [candidate division KSB1 bacterium]|nr:SAM-dependent methyltransferase [candidate division KSB1 bacterium]